MSTTEPESTSNSSTSDDSKNGSVTSLMNGKNRKSGNKSPVKQQNATSQQSQNNPNRCTWCAETKTALKYVLPTQNGKKEFCSETCIAEFRKAYSKGACKECDNAIRGNAPNREFCSTYCLNKNNKKKGITDGNQAQPQAPSTSQNKLINHNNNNLENNNSKQQQKNSSSVETNNNNTIKEHAVTKISPMFQFEPFHVFDWNEYLKV